MKSTRKVEVDPTVQQLFDLTGKTALITGGTGFLGRSLASALAEAGARVIVCSTSQERAESLAHQLTDPNSIGHLGLALNHMNEAGIDQAINSLQDKVSHIDILVNNGHEANPKDWTTVNGEEFTRQLANATGYFLLARRIRNLAVEANKSASILLLGSMYGLVASYPDCYDEICPASPPGYHALKGGIIHLTRHLAVYWAQDQVRVNCISPGPFPSDLAPEKLKARLVERVPLKRIGQPSELKGAVVYLASDASSYVTGHNLVVDGGWTAW
ncbi:SDR family oxidoreductase [Bythopirellula goksoeyrii]|uniref:3-oxoacyl-[acyl-carrier-protein] reductase FabG n=1 Tax=Bythopirellula goksoeyrii TaxID=1400387 RepID=A0A5B9Q7B1_9BACT|nr:SDR family oxidoreductase [Bythopirellula goksoeyrii]QEG33435.1 3-oxoacyl-[acyl-carrier-protein] reductase FabG [Bythopirellula goksoeyrii]